MTQNIGEELVGQYLLFCEGCDFVAYNVDTRDVQGEIDVVATKVAGDKREIFICEVAIHLVTGLHYVRDKQDANVAVLVKKFTKDIQYAQKYFPGYDPVPMLWSPVVRGAPRGGKLDQLRDVATIKQQIDEEFDTDLQLICNAEFAKRVAALRRIAAETSRELKSPVMRLFQLQAKLDAHVARSSK